MKYEGESRESPNLGRRKETPKGTAMKGVEKVWKLSERVSLQLNPVLHTFIDCRFVRRARSHEGSLYLTAIVETRTPTFCCLCSDRGTIITPRLCTVRGKGTDIYVRGRVTSRVDEVLLDGSDIANRRASFLANRLSYSSSDEVFFVFLPGGVVRRMKQGHSEIWQRTRDRPRTAEEARWSMTVRRRQVVLKTVHHLRYPDSKFCW